MKPQADRKRYLKHFIVKFFYFYLFFIFLYVSPHANKTFAQAPNITETKIVSTTTTEFCKSLNSLNIYSKESLVKIQNYIKQGYFVNLKTSGVNDLQTRYYIGRYQYAFGLRVTGTLNSQTVKFLKEQNQCFDLEKKIKQVENRKIRDFSKQNELINTLLNDQVNFIPHATVFATTTSQ
jgi:hypothetical protein